MRSLATLALVLFCTSILRAQDNPLDRKAPGPVKPGPGKKLQPMQVPAFIKPGARISYSFSANAESDNPRKAGLGGKGVSRHEIVAVLPGRVIVQRFELFLSVTTGQPYLGMAQTFATTAADVTSGAAIWMPPAELLKLRSTPGINVIRGPFTMHGSQYDAISIDVQQQGVGLKRIFDAKTGLKLVEFSATGRNRRVGNVGGMNRKTQSRDSYETYRVMKLPWYAGKAPAWTKQIKKVVYRGKLTHGAPGIGQIVVPRESVFTITERVGDLLIGTATHRDLPNQHGLKSSSTKMFVSGAAQLGGLWIDPAVLQSMKPGLLDQDPLTKSTLHYSIVNTEDGKAGLITESHPSGSYKLVWGYALEDGSRRYMYFYQHELKRSIELEYVSHE